VVIEAGRAEATFSELSRLKPGSILALDMASPGRVLVVANGTPIAHGSLVTRGNRVAVQIESLVSPGGAGR
jgi:flagellar motor switch/type III secretory pathway protein FliN